MDFSDGKSPAKIVSNAGVRFVGISHLARDEGNILSGFLRGSIIRVSPTKDLLEPVIGAASTEKLLASLWNLENLDANALDQLINSAQPA